MWELYQYSSVIVTLAAPDQNELAKLVLSF